MQSTLFEPTNLPQIEPAGPLSRVVFEEPLMGMVIVMLVGIAAALVLQSRGKMRWGLCVFGFGVLIAGGMFLMSRVVVTDREVLSMRATALVDAVAVGDEAVMRSLMAGHVRVQTKFAGAEGRDRVVALAAARVPRLVESHSVREVRADFPGPRVGRTMVKVRVQGSMAPSSSWWMIHWEREDASSDKWNALYIEPVWIQGVNDPGG